VQFLELLLEYIDNLHLAFTRTGAQSVIRVIA